MNCQMRKIRLHKFSKTFTSNPMEIEKEKTFLEWKIARKYSSLHLRSNNDVDCDAAIIKNGKQRIFIDRKFFGWKEISLYIVFFLLIFVTIMYGWWYFWFFYISCEVKLKKCAKFFPVAFRFFSCRTLCQISLSRKFSIERRKKCGKLFFIFCKKFDDFSFFY